MILQMFCKYEVTRNNEKRSKKLENNYKTTIKLFAIQNLLKIYSLWIGEQIQCTWPTPNSLQLIYNFVICSIIAYCSIIVFYGKLLKNKFGWFCLMCLVCLKGPNMEKEVDKTLERNRKKEYCNILKLFGLGHFMSTILFFRVWLWNQEIARTY
jgi:hypothetical protein